jgi:hypothetical protein
MKVNIKSIKVIKGNENYCFRINDGNMEYDTNYYIGKSELELVLSCLLGKAEFYPSFNDGMYLIRFVPDGIHAIELSPYMSYCRDEKKDGCYKDRNFVFPGKELAQLLQMLELFEQGEYDFSDKIPEWVEKYSPKVQVNIEPDVKAKLEADLVHDLLDEETPRNLIDYLTGWAEGYSDGELVQVNIVFDSWKNPEDKPSNYYWWICDENNNRIVNGGFIAHENKGKYSYSVHT